MTPQKQSRLIESFIMNVPVPPIFLYEYKYSYYEVMDGLQRLTAIDEFYNNKLILDGLDEWPELNGKQYSTLPKKVKEGIDRRHLSSIILLQATAKTAKSEEEAQILKRKVFERINSGGVKLEPQESRNAIYNGVLNALCIELSRNIYLHKAWDIPAQEEIDEGKVSDADKSLGYERYCKMFDVELVLRFFAYRQRQNVDAGGVSRDYLDSYLQFGVSSLNRMVSSIRRQHSRSGFQPR